MLQRNSKGVSERRHKGINSRNSFFLGQSNRWYEKSTSRHFLEIKSLLHICVVFVIGNKVRIAIGYSEAIWKYDVSTCTYGIRTANAYANTRNWGSQANMFSSEKLASQVFERQESRWKIFILRRSKPRKGLEHSSLRTWSGNVREHFNLPPRLRSVSSSMI